MAWYDNEEELKQEPFTREDIENIKATLELPQGYRFILKLLKDLGAEGSVSTSEYDVALRNFAERLLAMCQAASFNKMIQLISDIRSDNMEFKHGRSSQ